MPDSTADDWTVVFSSATDYEADLLRDRLAAAGFDALVNTQRDHAFNLTVGELAQAHVLVRANQADEARALLAEAPVSDAELEAQALAADPLLPDADTPQNEARTDSGAETISFDVPGDEASDAGDAPRGAPLA